MEPKDLIDILTNNENPADYWSNSLIYKSEFLFTLYANIYEDLAKELRIGEYKKTELIKGHETFLGYLPDKDIFISGWDIWEGNNNASGLVFFQFVNETLKIISSDIMYTGNMYDVHGGLPFLEKEFSNLETIKTGI